MSKKKKKATTTNGSAAYNVMTNTPMTQEEYNAFMTTLTGREPRAIAILDELHDHFGKDNTKAFAEMVGKLFLMGIHGNMIWDFWKIECDYDMEDFVDEINARFDELAAVQAQKEQGIPLIQNKGFMAGGGNA